MLNWQLQAEKNPERLEEMEMERISRQWYEVEGRLTKRPERRRMGIKILKKIVTRSMVTKTCTNRKKYQ